MLIKMFEGQITTIGTEQTLHPRIIKNQLNQHLGMVSRQENNLITYTKLATILPNVDDEIKASLADLIPPCDGM
jgi:ent-kaurene oxidase